MKIFPGIFAGVFLCLVSLPFVLMDHKSTVSEKENRSLAAFPRLIEAGKINEANAGNMPRMIDAYINDRFGFRNGMISLANGIFTAGKTIRGYAVLGKDNWLFYSNPDDGSNIVDFYKMNLFTEVEINRFIVNIQKRIDWCNNNGIQFVFLIAPNKHNIYLEYFPFERPEGITRTEQVLSTLPDDLKQTVLYPRDYLIQNKGDMPLYFETDTHWNRAGAYCAFEILYGHIKNMFPHTRFPEIRFTTEVSYDSFGDLVPMAGFTSYGKRTIPDIRPLEGWDSYYRYLKNEARNGVITENNDASLPRAIIYRDSFFTALEPFVSNIFSYAEYHWRSFSEVEKKYILKQKPDIIVWEIVERGIAGIPAAEWK